MQDLIPLAFFAVFALNLCYLICFLQVLRRLGRPWRQMTSFSSRRQIVAFLQAEVAQGQGDAKLALGLYRISSVLTPALAVLLLASVFYRPGSR
ncbi:hypothetical protein ACFOLG_07855 [Vogesella facilis]|uniref:Uncharacterized protein n=1 Tax=Vogesella facilis TaxID=1655232 RepID=A0ABV7RCT1_9NEIS